MIHEGDMAIPIDSYPDPVVAYAIRDGVPLVTATNDAFDATFEKAPVESPVSEIFDLFEIVESTGDDTQSSMVRGEPSVVYLDGSGETGTYLTRIVPVNDDDGVLVFTPLDSVLGNVETAGVGRVARVLSHDLRNPLDVAKAHLREGRETGDPEHFDAVVDAHDRMEAIIRDVLTLARGGNGVERSEQLSIENAVEDAWQSVNTERATLAVPDTLPVETADSDRLRRLFENLFRNAVEHGSTSSQSEIEDAGERSDETVSVRVGTLEDGFYVADDGPGIPPGERDAVFDPGYSTEDGGTGLGLAIVDQVVAAHGWDLQLTSSRTGGARFEVRF